MSINTFPRELISLIMDYLSDDRESLKAASLVSRIFLPTCRSHLFKNLCMSSFNPVFDYQCSAWVDILRHSSDVLQYVKILEIGPPLLRSRSIWSTHFRLQSTASEDTLRPSINDPRLESILAGIIRPRSVTLRFQLSQWRNTLPSLQKEVTRLINQESLTFLCLEDINDFPLEILYDCRNLLHLSLISVHPSLSVDNPNTTDPEIIVEHGPPSKKGFLDTLTLMTSDQSIEALIFTLSASRSRLRLSRLRTLSINIGLMNGPDILHKLSRAAPNLASITLRLTDQSAYSFCNPKDFPKLRSLVISSSYYRPMHPIQALASFLSNFSIRSALEELTILFRQDVLIPQLEHENTSQSLERICSNPDWQLVEEQCMVAGRFPLLRKMSIAFRPKDVKNFMSYYLDLTLPLHLMQVMPTLYVLTSPTIELFEDQFEAHQYVPPIFNLNVY